MHAITVGGVVAAACLIGGTLSKGSEQALIAPGFPCRLIKRLVARDDCVVPESQLLRASMRDVANKLGYSYFAVSYADPIAQDTRSGLGLYGHLYLASGYFFLGFTSQSRWAVVDDTGALRSTRQGSATLHKKTLPKAGDGWNGRVVTRDWRMTNRVSRFSNAGADLKCAWVWLPPAAPVGGHQEAGRLGVHLLT